VNDGPIRLPAPAEPSVHRVPPPQPTRLDGPPMRIGDPVPGGPTPLTAEDVARLGEGGGNAAASRLVRSTRVDTPFGTFEVYPAGARAPRPASHYGDIAWPIGRTEFDRLGPLLQQISAHASKIKITGDQLFRASTLRSLAWLGSSPLGLDLLRQLSATSHTVTIVSAGGSGNNAFVTGGGDDVTLHRVGKRLTPGRGADCTVTYDADDWDPWRHADVREPWMSVPPPIHLVHELIHAYQITHGTVPPQAPAPVTKGPVEITERHGPDELRTVGIMGYEAEHFTENRFRQAFGLPLRPTYNDVTDDDPTPRPERRPAHS